ncbi:MAG TPA: single-stranded DNA-binding protein, partial [Dehalococcoidia bacterium]|nr:single-stranded DNA-binding protein [Dehalococcoidia bacterium]
RALPRLYPFGINRGRLAQTAKDMNLNLELVDKLSEADLLVTSKSYYRRRPQKIRDAEASNLPVYVLRKHTSLQLRQLLSTIQPSDATGNGGKKTGVLGMAIREAEEATNQVLNGQEAVELTPQSAYIRRLQHLIAERNDLLSHSTGKEPNRRVKIYKEGV